MISADTAPGAGAALTVAAAAAPSSAQVLQLGLEQLQALDGAALREEWRRLRRSEPPRISRDLLLRAIAYRLQEVEFGELPKWARQGLAGSTKASDADGAGGERTHKPAAPRLKPGARLVREWHGRTHAIVVLDDAFEFEERRYRSLTEIARKITGAHWSGPRFFGLAKRKVALASDPAGSARSEGISSLAPLKRVELSIESMPKSSGTCGSDVRRFGRRAKEHVDG